MTSTDRLTDRVIYTAIAEGTLDNLDVDAITAWAEKKIAQLDHKAAKAKETAAKKKAEGDELTDAVLAALTTEFEPIAEIASRIEGENVTVSRVSYRLNTLSKAENPSVEKGELVLDGEGKKRRVVGYRLIG